MTRSYSKKVKDEEISMDKKNMFNDMGIERIGEGVSVEVEENITGHEIV